MPQQAHRAQRSRKHGWRKPPNSVFVGRPTKWANPWTVIEGRRTAVEAVALYRAYALREFSPAVVQAELSGKVLLCWCDEDEACHADVLVELANRAFPAKERKHRPPLALLRSSDLVG